MLYGNQSISTYTPSNVAVWMVMAFQGGVINIGAFMACHQFASHVTGFATLFGLEIARLNYQQAIGVLLVPVLFLIGSIGSGLLVDIRVKLGKKPKYYIVFGVMLLLNLVVVVGGVEGIFGEYGEPFGHFRDYVLLALLCLMSGLQNGTVTSVSKAVVRTTHLTGLVTDLGIGLARAMNRSKLGATGVEDARANLMRIGLIASFIAGSVGGGFLFPATGFRGFFLPVAISGALFVVTFYFQRLKKPNFTADKRPPEESSASVG